MTFIGGIDRIGSNALDSKLFPVLLLLVAAWPGGSIASGQTLAAHEAGPARTGVRQSEPPPACEDGVVKDDGSVETGWGWVPSVVEGVYVQEFLAAEFASRRLESVCVCWLRTMDDADLDFEVVFYDSVELPEPVQGIERIPAEAPYAAVPAQAAGVPPGIVGAFYEVDVSGIEIPAGTSYIGVRWNPSADPFFFVCADTSPGTLPVNVFFRDDRAEGWDSVFIAADPIFVDHRAILVRARAELPAAVEVPALGAAGLGLLAALLAAAGVIFSKHV